MTVDELQMPSSQQLSEMSEYFRNTGWSIGRDFRLVRYVHFTKWPRLLHLNGEFE